MDLMSLLAASALSDAIGKFIYEILYQKWILNWASDWGIVGAFSVTVIMFTVFLKIVVFPFDLWQKQISRKNNKKMAIMKPELEKITKQCGSNKEMLMQKQRALYKKYKYSTFGACLPMIITLVIFFIVFAGYNSAVRLHNKTMYEDLLTVYTTTYDAEVERLDADESIDLSDEEIGKLADEKAQEAVLANYKSERFFLTKNIFVADTWKDPVPSASDFTGTGLGGSGVEGIDTGMYERVMAPVMEKYNNTWNGYLILPILVLILNIVSMKLNKTPEQPAVAGQSEEQVKAQQSQMKMMQYIMPIMMLVFALFYSAAFTLYMFVNSLLTTLFNLLFNIITKKIDEKEKDRIMSVTVKK